MTYNFTNLSSSMNESGILGAVQVVNDNFMLGWLGTLFLIGVAMVILTSLIFSTNDLRRSFAATSFITFALSLFLRALSLIPDIVIFITLIVCAITVAFSWKRD